MDCPKPQLAFSSQTLRSLEALERSSDGDLEQAISAVRTHMKNVHIPSYDSFGVQGWKDYFRDSPRQSKREQGLENPENGESQPSLPLEKLETLLSPPSSFFKGHLAGELPSIIDAIGCTPLVRLTRIAAAAQVACQLLGKCEYLSAGGSIKDRIARGMILTAEATGQLGKGAAVIEPTSGNTGIGLALVAAVKGYRSVAVMPMKMSAEKHTTMKALGATILRTPTKAAWDDQTSHIALAIRLEEEMQEQEKRKRSQNGHSGATKESASKQQVASILDQYRNPANPLAHFFGTGVELVHQAGQKLDMVIISAGTGGTLTGIGRRIKETLPNCLVVAVDPVGSILANPNEPPGKPYLVEGIGYDFVPTVLDGEVPDFWVKVTDAESLMCSRLLIKLEGMLVGGSAGSALAGAFKAIESLGWTNDSTKRVAIILPDGSRNYTSKFVSDEWMADKGFLPPEALDAQYPELENTQVQSLKLPCLKFVAADTPLEHAGRMLLNSDVHMLCVVESAAAAQAEKIGCAAVDAVLGIVTEAGLLKALGEVPRTTPVVDIAETDTPIFSKNTPVSRIAQSLNMRQFVLVEVDGLVRHVVGRTQLLEQSLIDNKKDTETSNGNQEVAESQK